MINLATNDWELENIETVFFDKDGTFIDLHYFWGQMTELRVKEIIKRFKLNDNCFEKLCLCLGYAPKTGKMLKDGITALYSRSKIIELFKTDLLDFGVKTTDSTLEEIFDYVSSEFYKEMQKYTKPIEDAIEFIKKLKNKKIKLGIVTSDSVESTKLTLKYFGWDSIFEVVIGRESSPHTKESGEPVKLALQLAKANPETTIMIGDAPMDYLAASRAGISRTILVSTGQIDKNTLAKTSKYVLDSLSEITIKDLVNE